MSEFDDASIFEAIEIDEPEDSGVQGRPGALCIVIMPLGVVGLDGVLALPASGFHTSGCLNSECPQRMDLFSDRGIETLRAEAEACKVLDDHCDEQYPMAGRVRSVPEFLMAQEYARLCPSDIESTDMGLGQARLVSFRHVELDGENDLYFGYSDASISDGEEPNHMSKSASVTFGLWSTDQGPVLTAEWLDLPEGVFADGYGDSLIKQSVDQVLAHLIDRTTLNSKEASFADLFVDAQLPRSIAAKVVVNSGVDTVERVRGRSLSNGLIVMFGTASQIHADRLGSDDFDEQDEDQESGQPHSWQRVEVSTQPANGEAASWFRDDHRAWLVNQDSMSVYHHYASGVVGGASLRLLPVVTYAASVDKQYLDLRHVVKQLNLKDPAVKLSTLLDTVWSIKRSILERDLDADRIGLEAFRAWAGPNTLSSLLYEATNETVRSREKRIVDASEVVTGAIERERLKRNGEVRKWTEMLAPIAALSVGVGLFATFVGVPAAVPWDVSPVWFATVLTGITLLTGVAIGSRIQKRSQG